MKAVICTIAFAAFAVIPRAHADVRQIRLDLELGDPAARSCRAIPHEHQRPPDLFPRARVDRVVADQIERRIVADAGRLRNRIIEASVEPFGSVASNSSRV